jgi:hypothetical protein
LGSSKSTAIIVGVYAALLLWALAQTPLWLDEVLQFGNRRNGSVLELMRWAQLNAGASPLPYLLQKFCVSLLGYSGFAARFPAALCSILSAAVFGAVSSRFLKESRWLALVMFLVLPIQFRYGMEARPYSQGLLFSLLSLWLFLKLDERYSTGMAILYGLSVSAGLYSQPLTLFPALAQAIYALPKRRAPALAVMAAVLSYLPWHFPAQALYATVRPPTTFFSWRQIHPLVLVHGITGVGYAGAIPLLALACGIFNKSEAPARRMLYYTFAAALAGPILMDAAFNYFFADRQLLFAMPAVVLLAAVTAQNGRLSPPQLAEPRPPGSGWRQPLVWSLAAVFLIAAAIKDFRQAVTPRDDLAATADAIAARLPPDACVQAQPPGHVDYYLFFRPELQARVCEAESAAPEIMMVASSYTLPSERRAPTGLAVIQSVKVGRSDLVLYRRLR